MENRQKIEPPHWAKYLLERITAPHLREEIEGRYG
jgi:hypothetical protein